MTFPSMPLPPPYSPMQFLLPHNFYEWLPNLFLTTKYQLQKNNKA